MVLFADSGSTKTDWRLITKDGKVASAQTVGFNPYYQTIEEIHNELKNSLVPQINSELVQEIYFYGAGCSSVEKCAMIEEALRRTFPKATKFYVDEDTMAAVRALCGDEDGIACILGTGSNSSLFINGDIQNREPNLGFWLGDEGSGGYKGKKLITDYLNRDMPPHILEKFVATFNPERKEVLDSMYIKPYPNRYAASYAKFIKDNINEPYCYEIAYNSFKEFFKKTVLKFPNHKNLKIHFVGSIAFHYQDLLRVVAADLGLSISKIIKSPIEDLTAYHQAQVTKKLQSA